MKSTIINISKVLLLLIIIFSISIISSCSKDGEQGVPGQDGINYANNTGFDVTNSVAQTIAVSTITPIIFNTEITDDANAFNSATSEYIIPTSGFYNINVKVNFLNSFPANTTGVLYLYKNDVLFKSTSQQIGVSPGLSMTINSGFTKNDKVKAFVLHNALSVNILKIGTENCTFSGYRIY